jgi:hypothetical protein
MDKVKGAMKKGLEKVTNMDQERKLLLLPTSEYVQILIRSTLAIQEDRKDTLDTTWPTREQHTSMTGGPDPNLARASHAGDPTGLTGKNSMGQPTNKP